MEARGWARQGGDWGIARAVVVPVREELASRTRGLLETAILADKRVFTAGVGSGAAPIVMEISSEEQAERIAYSDRPVAIEPGLSNDIAPISTMVVKLAIQHLIQGHPTTLSSLDEDLVAPWYLWLNRREKETDYAKLEPLEFNVDGMHVLRWYGIDLGRNDACPCCGDFVRLAAQQERLEVTSEDTAAFAASEEA